MAAPLPHAIRLDIEAAVNLYVGNIAAYAGAARSSEIRPILRILENRAKKLQAALGDVLNLYASDETFLKNISIVDPGDFERQLQVNLSGCDSSERQRRPYLYKRTWDPGDFRKSRERIYRRTLELLTALDAKGSGWKGVFEIYLSICVLTHRSSLARANLAGASGAEGDPYIFNLLNALLDGFYACGRRSNSSNRRNEFVSHVLSLLAGRNAIVPATRHGVFESVPKSLALAACLDNDKLPAWLDRARRVRARSRRAAAEAT
ncbi:hypothetical protein [Arenibaculum sp.]|uniref:hypothetical protein n=1 Tax=Arenibaculum sp. TaxID=2865862 RepID=UPI002E146306|nr:hypothetical protein [Arenibaculum sp.]